MLFYLAPMEELTGYVYRQVYQECFGEVDKYFTPFISPTKKKILKTRERKDVAPEHNQNQYVVPQILTNQIENLMDTIEYLLQLGYTEINLNLGCPAPTVVSKGKGAGMLEDPEELDRFFAIVFDLIYKEGLDQILQLSIKSRIGMSATYEFEDLLKVYNRYPISEVILHPRLREEFYQGAVHKEIFAQALEGSLHPLCYNGDITSVADYRKLQEEFPGLDRIMIGRGIMKNPALFCELAGGGPLTKEKLVEFHTKLAARYVEELGEKDALFKYKELWSYLICQCREMTEAPIEKAYRSLQKASSGAEYRNAVQEIFSRIDDTMGR